MFMFWVLHLSDLNSKRCLSWNSPAPRWEVTVWFNEEVNTSLPYKACKSEQLNVHVSVDKTSVRKSVRILIWTFTAWFGTAWRSVPPAGSHRSSDEAVFRTEGPGWQDLCHQVPDPLGCLFCILRSVVLGHNETQLSHISQVFPSVPLTLVGLGSLVPVKGNLNASAYKDTLDDLG